MRRARWTGESLSVVRQLTLAVAATLALPHFVWSETQPHATARSDDGAANEALATPTHRQTKLISANIAGQPNTSITCFCLTPDDRILAGCSGQEGEIRVFDTDGTYEESWRLPVKPEALFVRADGILFAAGEGQLVRLAADGGVRLQKPAPHAAAIQENPEKMREEVIAQAKQQAESLQQQTDQFQQMIDRADEQIATLEKQLEALHSDDTAENNTSDARRAAVSRQLLERRLASQRQMKKQYEAAKSQWDQMVQRNQPAELTEARIDQLVKASIASKLKVSSISATDEEVFVATRAATGYGFEIWRMDADFEHGESIVSELRGCCGQMDVKANANGLYVAENSRHRVCRFDREGAMLGAWGKGDRTSLEGFGSCCNPMNVAFGPGEAVYTAEDNTGRIKRYSLDGQLLGLIGSVDLVPGCKNCSIAVNADGSCVYMLDITRNHIVRMDGPAVDDAARAAGAARDEAGEGATNDDVSAAPPQTSRAGRVVAAGLRALLGHND